MMHTVYDTYGDQMDVSVDLYDSSVLVSIPLTKNMPEDEAVLSFNAQEISDLISIIAPQLPEPRTEQNVVHALGEGGVSTILIFDKNSDAWYDGLNSYTDDELYSEFVSVTPLHPENLS